MRCAAGSEMLRICAWGQQARLGRRRFNSKAVNRRDAEYAEKIYGKGNRAGETAALHEVSARRPRQC